MANEGERLWIKALVSGFSANPCTLTAAYDIKTGMVVFATLAQGMDAARKPGMLIITTQSRLLDFDCLFSAENFGEAITAYHNLQGYLHFGAAEVKRCDPVGAVEKDGYDENGIKVRINESVTNEKVAALAICWAVSKQEATIASIDMGDAISNFLSGAVISVGGDGEDIDVSTSAVFDFDDCGPLGRVYYV